jgi:hypothetical protein
MSRRPEEKYEWREDMGSPFSADGVDMGVQLTAKFPAYTVDRSSLKFVGGKAGVFLHTLLRRPELPSAVVTATSIIALIASRRQSPPKK